MSPARHVDPTTGRAIRNPYRENTEFSRFCLRILRSLSRRAGADIDMLRDLADLRDGVDELMRQSVAACRAEGYSWADVGERLGVTKQTAWERYGRTGPRASIQRQGTPDTRADLTVERVG